MTCIVHFESVGNLLRDCFVAIFNKKNEAKLLRVLDVIVSEVVTIESKKIIGCPSVFT